MTTNTAEPKPEGWLIQLNRDDWRFTSDEVVIESAIKDGCAYRALYAHAIPEGMRLVPVEPTEAMIEAGKRFADPYLFTSAEATYRSMIEAAPKEAT